MRGRPRIARNVLLLLWLALVPARAEQTLRMAVQAPFFVDPQLLFYGPNMAAARHIFDSLVGRDAEARWTPSLAQSWRPIDAQTWAFELRHGVTFHDGSPFTAADVVATFGRASSISNNPAPYTPNLRTIERTEIVDLYTVRIHTDRPNPTLPGQLTNILIIPAHLAHEPAEGASRSSALTR